MSDGSSVSTYTNSLHIRLADLLELLIDGLSDNEKNTNSSPFLAVDGQRLIVYTCNFMKKVLDLNKWTRCFNNAKGFIGDAMLLPTNAMAVVGGRLQYGTMDVTTERIRKFHEKISKSMDEALKGKDPESLISTSLWTSLSEMAESAKIRQQKIREEILEEASIVPIKFTFDNKSQNDRCISKALLATESIRIGNGTFLETLCEGIADTLRRKQKRDEDDVSSILNTIRNESRNSGSQVSRFLCFLEDQALARVRLQISMELMDIISAKGNSSKRLRTYVQRIKEFFDRFGSDNSESLRIDASCHYGESGNVDLIDYACNAGFYSWLPVWADHSTQLLETRDFLQNGIRVYREVFYRFKVNGLTPERGKPSFESKLDEIDEHLFDERGEIRRNVGQDIARLVFLYLVVPGDSDEPFNILREAKRIAEQVADDPVKALKRLHDSLSECTQVMKGIAKDLIDATKGISFDKLADSLTKSFVVSVHRNILNNTESFGRNGAFFVGLPNGDDSIEWLKYVTVSREAYGSGRILSYEVETQIHGHSLVHSEKSPVTRTKMKHDTNTPVLPIRFVPVLSDETAAKGLKNLFKANTGVDIYYGIKALGRGKNTQLWSPRVAAFTIFVYVVLWELQRRVRLKKPNTALNIMRLQTEKENINNGNANGPNTILYAISHAIEMTLGNEGTVKMQGIALKEDNTTGFRRHSAIHALFSGQRMHFDMQGSLDKAAVISYATRPCDSCRNGTNSDVNNDGYLFMVRTYTAEKQDNDAILQFQRMRTRLAEGMDEFKRPSVIFDEIAWLKNQGFEHIVLLSHHVNTRHIGRAAERHAPHGTLEFMDETFNVFNDLHIYIMRRDVFPAIRVSSRNENESAFEVTNFDDHKDIYVPNESLRGIFPVYTFATLVVVGKVQHPHSWFCTYFYEMDNRADDIKKMNTLVLDSTSSVRASIVSILRAIHFLEGEKPYGNSQKQKVLLPVLDPYKWTKPDNVAENGEIRILVESRRKPVTLSLGAMLTHVAETLRAKKGTDGFGPK